MSQIDQIGDTWKKKIKDYRCTDEIGNKFDKCPIDPLFAQQKKIYCKLYIK